MSLVNELADVVDAVAHHGQAVDAEAEGEARPLLGVDAARREHVGVDHAAAAQLEPADAVGRARSMSNSADGSVNGKYDGRRRSGCRRRSRPW